MSVQEKRGGLHSYSSGQMVEFRVIFQLHFLRLRLIFYFFLMKTFILLELLLLVLVFVVLKILVAKDVY